MKKKVVVGLSGGVDSSVSAALLLQQGYDVIGVFMRNWNDNSVIINNECPWIDDSNDALLVAQKLNIPFQVIDMSVEYKQRIVDYMIDEYDKGRTPNPDILCNREVKFDLFLNEALKLGADYVATGHYCQKSERVDSNGNITYSLKVGKDNNKDQSYFLCQVNQYQLSKALFPIGHLEKFEVRALAKEYDLITAEKKDSQGLCFIGKVKLPDFLKTQLVPKEGDVRIVEDKVNIDEIYTDNSIVELCKEIDFSEYENESIGTHNGVQFYTIGQRKGIGIGGTGEPIYVLSKDAETNTLYVGKGYNHWGLNRKGLFIDNKDIHWIREDLKMNVGEKREYLMRIRYRQKLFPSTLILENEGMFIIFDKDQKSIAKGQFAAWYDGDELIGSGVIN